MTTQIETQVQTPAQVDARSVRFGAGITATIFAAAFLTAGSPIATALLLFQTAVFAAVVAGGFKYSLYGRIFRALVAPRLKSKPDLEPAAAPHFAQIIGLGCASVATSAALLGLNGLSVTFTAITFLASFLNAAFNFCLGCEIHVLLQRLKPTR
jgi:hypothetical protein